MTPAELRDRTRVFAVAVTRAVKPLFTDIRTRHSASQLMRAATSVAANYRATGLSRSRAEFISKLSVVVEEADEVVFWLDVLADTEPATAEIWSGLRSEAAQLVRIFAASRRTATTRAPQTPPTRPKPR